MKNSIAALALIWLVASPAWAQLQNKWGNFTINPGSTVIALNGVISSEGGTFTVDGTLSTPVDLINTNGATLQGDGQYHIGGNWTNDANFNAGASTVTFEGPQNSTVASGGAAFNDVVLTKNDGLNLLLADNMAIGNSLDFQATNNYVVLGNFNLQAGDMLGYEASRHVRTDGTGFLVRTVAGAPVVFPVGNTTYNPATLTNAGTSDLFRVRVADNVLAGGYSGNAYQTNAVDRSWFMEEAVPGGSDLSLALLWNGNEELTGFDRTMAYVSSFDGGLWDNQAAGAATGADPYILSRTGITTLTPFAVLSGNFQPVVNILGQIRWKGDGVTGVKDAAVTFSGDFSGLVNSDASGNYSTALAGNGNLTITPTKNVNLLNGITVGDKLAIQQHLTDINPITDPYVWIAMDVDRDNEISTFDALQISQALLNNPQALNIFNKSWRFVPAAYPLALPPWGFPEQIDLTGVSSNQSGQDFYGVKLGDVIEEFADPANFGGSGSSMAPLVWRVQDRMLEAGQDIQVTFAADFLENIAAFQFGLRFDTQYLELEDVEQLAALPLGDDHFGLFEAHLGEFRAAWSHHEGFELPHGSKAFHLHFKVLESGVNLSSILGLDESLLQGLVYNNQLEHNEVQLHFSPATGTHDAQADVLLFDNFPNPFVNTTNISFSLPESCAAQLRVLDESGHELFRVNRDYPAGNNMEQLNLGDLSAAGMLVCELATPFGVLTKKMVRVGG
ncbi:MAG: hypothetical protein H6569_12870 [Lewinellaceae bacterium]|nr:hypothetical protein [Lewinellaceae bacterium]